MNVTILGASGQTGRFLVGQALDAGHTVTALVRTPEAFGSSDPTVSVVPGDAREQADLAKALVGADAVISALGSMRSEDELIRRSLQALVPAATDAGVSRVVVLSTYLVAPTYKPSLRGRLSGRGFAGMTQDKRAGEALLRGSDLDWTIVHATTLDRTPAGSPVRVMSPDEPVTMGHGVARADVARFLVAELGDAGHHRQAVVVTSA